ncbi:MAG: fatty acid desaturase [Sphingobium sp.]
MLGKLNGATDLPRVPIVEFPTILVAMTIYGGWMLLTAFHRTLPPLLLFVLGGIVVAWHGSFQHETIHGHPTRSRWINAAIGSIPLSLWLPYAIYRRTHIAHHATPHITDPFDDPESQYLTRASGPGYWLARSERTLLGRLILGPPIRIASFLLAEVRRLAHEPAITLREWVPHLVGVAVILLWLHHVDLPAGTYLLTFIYPGTALSLLRSFAEHRADEDQGARAAIIPRAGPFGLLFLNNNLHAVHHGRPDLPWYRLPAHYRRHRTDFTRAPEYASYGEVARRFLLVPHDSVVHPDYRKEAPVT